MRLSVVIACLNAEATLAETLDGLLAQNLPALSQSADEQTDDGWEIILSDNGSTDRSNAIFEDYARRNATPAMRIVDASDRRGKAHALNVALHASQGRLIAFCDADDVVGDGWLPAVCAALETEEIIAVRMDYDRLNVGWVREYRSHEQVEKLARVPFPPYCVYAGGATLAFRREVFDRLGGFDTQFQYLEDNDFCIRAFKAGYALKLAPAAVLHVRSRTELDAICRQGRTWGEYEALLCKRHRQPRVHLSWRMRRLGRVVKAWTSLAVASLRLSAGQMHLPLTLAKFQFRLGTEIGRIRGALKYRTWPL